MPDGLTLEEVASKANAVKGNAGLIRNPRGLGIRIYREHIAEARQTLLKDDDRIDEHTAQVLIRVQHKVPRYSPSAGPCAQRGGTRSH